MISASTDATTTTQPPSTAIQAESITSRAGGTTTLHPTSFSVSTAQIVGIAGGSGAGKTTLLETLAGLRRPASGEVRRSERSAFVPQDDIIHADLPLRRTLIHAAALRIAGLDAEGRAEAVEAALGRLDLSAQRDVVVGDLSGGQRKRASIAAEMLTDPQLLFLDEPTSGLDPANAAELMRSLALLAEGGSTIVMTTHSPADLARCDQVIFVARGGHVAFIGTPDDARVHFGVTELADIYEQLNEPPTTFVTSEELGGGQTDDGQTDKGHIDDSQTRGGQPTADHRRLEPAAPPRVRQWATLVRRNIDLIRGNRLTLAILVGSPVFIISMMVMLFPSGIFDADAPSVSPAIQVLFWMAFNSFFFGLTYGLLQVVGEFEIVRRERRVGLGMGAYVASKVAVLVPMLAVVNVVQIASLQLSGRLPDLDAGEALALFTSLQLLSVAAVAIGLHASSAVHNPAQATLALPMLCFPQVLFAGAVVPVSSMGWLSELLSLPLATRWAFEASGRLLDLGDAAAGEAGTVGFVDAFTGSVLVGWAVLVGLIAVGTVGTIRTLTRRTAPGQAR